MTIYSKAPFKHVTEFNNLPISDLFDTPEFAEAVNNLVPTSSYKVYTALLTQNGGDDIQSTDMGLITVGVTYRIANLSPNMDFTNVGAPNNNVGTYFVATGTTPNSWGSNEDTGNSTLEWNNGAPVVTVLENTIGNIWFSYDDIGSYIIQGDFPSNKTTCIISNIGQVPSDYISIGANIQLNNIYIPTISLNFVGGGNYSDNILLNTPIEIRVYN